MIKWLFEMIKWLFGMQRKPKAGETWILRDLAKKREKDPFEPKLNIGTVEIREVKDGWVRYDFPNFFKDERDSIRSFCFFYKFLED